jgi:ribosome-binding protein aMBF1 (putative translation factor)
MTPPCNSCERLVEALEFYADKKHVAEDQWFEGEAGYKDICTENGEIARKALSEHATSQQPSPQPVSSEVQEAVERLRDRYKRAGSFRYDDFNILIEDIETLIKAAQEAEGLRKDNYDLAWKLRENRKCENVIADLQITNNQLRSRISDLEAEREACGY